MVLTKVPQPDSTPPALVTVYYGTSGTENTAHASVLGIVIGERERLDEET
ncbi:hypothetical protein MD484_g3166, partial [Candolleomyces efflorescens]